MAAHLKYSQELAEEIIELYASGKHMVEIEALDHMPTRRAINYWRRDHAWFDKELVDVLDIHTDALLYKAIKAVLDSGTLIDIKRADVLQKVITWTVGRLNRAKYGDKFEVEVNKKIDISPILARAIANMNKVTVHNPPQLVDVQVASQD